MPPEEALLIRGGAKGLYRLWLVRGIPHRTTCSQISKPNPDEQLNVCSLCRSVCWLCCVEEFLSSEPCRRRKALNMALCAHFPVNRGSSYHMGTSSYLMISAYESKSPVSKHQDFCILRILSAEYHYIKALSRLVKLLNKSLLKLNLQWQLV